MNAFKVFCLAISILCCQSGLGQNAHQLLRKGDKAYNQERFELAEENYRKAIEKRPNTKGSFNLGNTVYNQERFEEAAQHYQQTLNGLSEEAKKAQTLYNLGNAQLQSGQLEEAIESYKSAVILDPEDDDIRQNLYLAKLLRKEQQQQQRQEQQEQDQDSQEENNEEQQDQEQQQQQEGENDQQDQQSSQSDIDNQGGASPTPEEAQELSREDAEKLLQVIENEEKNVQEKLRKLSGNKKKPKKDW